MTVDTVVYLGQKAMLLTLLLSAPMLLSGMVVGLIISVFQSVTQIQEITLTFVPKIIAVFLAFVLFMPFMISTMLQFSEEIIGGFTGFIR